MISVSNGSTPSASEGGMSAMIFAHKICIVVNGSSKLNEAHLVL